MKSISKHSISFMANRHEYIIAVASVLGWIILASFVDQKPHSPLGYGKESSIISYEGKKGDNETFQAYWNDGKGEVSSYSLSQARYGEIHQGEATLIFVTEPFSKSKQVKLDDYANYSDRVDVLKMNSVRKFHTGIYPYSAMTSVFNKVEDDYRAIKWTASLQEWCGHVFMQFNTKGNSIQYEGKSYFESEGDVKEELRRSWAEDELWNLIRINPDRLPTGNIDIIPASLYLRLNHHEPQIVKAKAELTKSINPEFSESAVFEYKLNYKQPEERSLSIYFESQFPYQILGWKDTYEDIAWNSERKVLTTTAKLKKTIRLDYWNKNKLADQNLQALLN